MLWCNAVRPVSISALMEEEAAKLRAIIELHRAISKEDLEEIKKILAFTEKVSGEVNTDKYHIKKQDKNNNQEPTGTHNLDFAYLNEKTRIESLFDFDYARHKIGYAFMTMLNDVKPHFIYPSNRWQWLFPTLLSAMYLMAKRTSKATINAKDNEEKTALDWAVSLNKPDIIVLIKKEISYREYSKRESEKQKRKRMKGENIWT